MSKKSRTKTKSGFVDYPGRQVEFLPSFIPRIEEIMHAAVFQIFGVDFGQMTIHGAVEAMRDGIATLFVEVSQKDINEPIIFSIQSALVNRALGRPGWLAGPPRTVRNYRGTRRYKFLGEPVSPVGPMEPDSVLENVTRDMLIANMTQPPAV